MCVIPGIRLAGLEVHEELGILRALAQEEEQALHGIRRFVACEGAADEVDFLELDGTIN